jgi:hypothetical protein
MDCSEMGLSACVPIVRLTRMPGISSVWFPWQHGLMGQLDLLKRPVPDSQASDDAAPDDRGTIPTALLERYGLCLPPRRDLDLFGAAEGLGIRPPYIGSSSC